MATLKIYQVQSKVRQPGDQAQGGLIPVSLATQLGKGLGEIGKVVDDIRKDQRREENENEATDIITGLNSKISQSYSKYSKGTNIDNVTLFNNDLMGLKYEASNKPVKKIVDKYIRDQRLDLGLKLSNQLISNSVTKSKDNKDQNLNSLISAIAKNDGKTSFMAKKKYDNFFQNPQEEYFYGLENFRKLKKEKDKLLISSILINRINNNDIDLTDNETRKEINKVYGPLGSKKYLDKARNKTLSIELNLDNEIKKQEIIQVDQQLNNFTTILESINLSKSDPSKKEYSLDQIYDTLQDGQINTVMYNALIKYYANPKAASNEEMVEQINAQFAYAATAEDVDQIKRSIHSDRVLIEGLNPEETIVMKGLLDKYGKDIVGLQDYKKYQELLKTDVGNVSNVYFSLSGADSAADKKKLSQKAVGDYNRYINNGFSPENAYLKSINNFTDTKKLPKIEDLDMRLSVKIDTSDLEMKIQNDPISTKTNLYQKVVDEFKRSQNVNDYRENIKRLDFIFDVYKVRKDLGANIRNKSKMDEDTK